MELPLWAESVWRTVDGMEKDQEAGFWRVTERDVEKEGLEEKGGEASLTRKSLD